jgi:hypothetical protein
MPCGWRYNAHVSTVPLCAFCARQSCVTSTGVGGSRFGHRTVCTCHRASSSLPFIQVVETRARRRRLRTEGSSSTSQTSQFGIRRRTGARLLQRLGDFPSRDGLPFASERTIDPIELQEPHGGQDSRECRAKDRACGAVYKCRQIVTSAPPPSIYFARRYRGRRPAASSRPLRSMCGSTQ